MRKIKPVAIAMVFIMLMPMLMSCSSSIKKNTVVKADDPWYESTRFEIKEDIRQNEIKNSDCLCASNDKLFNIYNMTADNWGSSRTVLDTYDLNGNLLKRQEVSCPDNSYILAIESVIVSSDGKSLNAIVAYLGFDKPGPIFTSIDTETGKLSNIRAGYKCHQSTVHWRLCSYFATQRLSFRQCF